MEKDVQKTMGVGLEAAQRTPGCLVYMTWEWEAQGFHDMLGGTLKRSENHGY